MPTIAPRFQSEGVHVGSMPVPDVKPAMGGAQSLAAIGETLAGLGKTVDRVQDTQARRQAFAEAAAREKQRSAETAAADLAMEWKSRNEKRREDFNRSGIGAKVYDEYSKFVDAFEADTGEDLTKDKSPEVATEFKRRTDIYRRDIQSAADQHAFVQNQAYTRVVSERELKASAASASLALASGKTDSYVASLGQAATAAQRLSESTGMPMDKDGLVGGIHYDALRALLADDPRRAVKFFNENSGKFSQYSDDAKRVVSAAEDTVWSMDTAQKSAQSSLLPNGLVDWDKAFKAVGTETGADDKRVQATQQRLEALQADEYKMRGRSGTSAIAYATQSAQLTLEQKEQRLSDKEYQRLVSMALPEQLEAIRHAEQDIDNRVDSTGLKHSAMYGGRQGADYFIAESETLFSKHGLSAKTRDEYLKLAQELKNGRGDQLRDRIVDETRRAWMQSGKPMPPRSYTGEAKGKEYELMKEFDTFVDLIHTEFQHSKSLDPKSDNDVKRVITQSMTTTVDRANGGLTSGGVEKVPAISLYDFGTTQDRTTRAIAGITDSDTLPMRNSKLYAVEEAAKKQVASVEQRLKHPANSEDYQAALKDAYKLGIMSSKPADEKAGMWSRISDLENTDRSTKAEQQAEQKKTDMMEFWQRSSDLLRVQQARERAGK